MNDNGQGAPPKPPFRPTLPIIMALGVAWFIGLIMGLAAMELLTR